MEIRFLGHAAFELTDGETSVLIDPFLSGNPKAAVSRRGIETGCDPADARPRRPHRRHRRDRQEHRRACGGDRGDRQRARRRGSGECPRPQHRGDCRPWTGARSSWCPPGTPRRRRKGTVNTPAGLIVEIRREEDLPPWRHCLFSDLGLIAKQAGTIDVALMCIGGHYTMDRLTRSRPRG